MISYLISTNNSIIDKNFQQKKKNFELVQKHGNLGQTRKFEVKLGRAEIKLTFCYLVEEIN